MQKNVAQKGPTVGLKCVHLSSIVSCSNPCAASNRLLMHLIERCWFSMIATPHQSSMLSREDTTETVPNSTPCRPVAGAIKSLKPAPARGVPWRRFLVGDIFANATAACRFHAFLAVHLNFEQRAQRRLDPNWNLALRDSHLLAGRGKNGRCAVGVLGDTLWVVLAEVDRQGVFEVRAKIVGGRFMRWMMHGVVLLLLLLVFPPLLLLLSLLLLLIGNLGSADAARMRLVGLRVGGC